MKSCPECGRDYYDETLIFCLDDGAHLVDGPGSSEEPVTAVLNASVYQASEETTKVLKPKGTRPGKDASTQLRIRKLIAAILVVLFVIAIAAGIYRYHDRFFSKQIESVAVLPFENGSGDPEFDYVSEGISENLIDRLSQFGQLKVIARSSSFQYRDKSPNLKEIAAALGVESIVTGRVLLRDGTYHIRVELVDVRENKQIWGENYTRKASEIQGLESEISREIAENLHLSLSGEQTTRLKREGTTNPTAYEMLLRGRFFNNKLGTENRLKAVDYFQRATILDPTYALAYAELALNYTNLVVFGGFDPQQYMPKAEAAARKAIELDSQLAEAAYAQATFARYRWDWLRAESEYKRAIELNPSHARMHNGYALYLSGMGRHDEASDVMRKALELDPLSPLINMNHGVILYSARRYDEALSAFQKTLELDRNYPLPHVQMGITFDALGMYKEAIAAYQEAIELKEDSSRTQILLGCALAKAGEVEQAREILRRLESSNQYSSNAELALLFLALGERKQAFLSLDKAFDAREAQLLYIGSYPAYDGFRDEPRFKDLLNKMGLSK